MENESILIMERAHESGERLVQTLIMDRPLRRVGILRVRVRAGLGQVRGDAERAGREEDVQNMMGVWRPQCSGGVTSSLESH